MKLDRIIQDLRFAIALWYKYPKFYATIAFCLILGMGPSTVVFSVVNQMVLTLPDLHQPQKIYQIGRADEPEQISNINHPHFERLRDLESISGVTAVSISSSQVRLQDQQFEAFGMVVSSEFFEVAHVQPHSGRIFTREKEEYPGEKREIVLGYYFCMDQFANPDQAIGTRMDINGTSFEIVGVMPKTFTGFMSGFQPDYFIPLMMIDVLRPANPSRLVNEDENWLMIFARLKDGFSSSNLKKELKEMSRDLYPEGSNTTLDAIALDGLGGNAGFIKKITLLVSALFVAILLIACSSIASLLLIRGTHRMKEISIRLALGATRRRMIGMLLMESFALALICSLFSILAAWWALDLILTSLPNMNWVTGSPVNASVLTFSFGLSLFAGLAFGLAPAFAVTKPDLVGQLKSQPLQSSQVPRISWLRRIFVVIQIGLCLFLLIMVGLFVRGFYRAFSVDPGFESEQLVNYEVRLEQFGYNPDEMVRGKTILKDQLSRLPGVNSVAVARLGPLPTHRTATIVQAIQSDLSTGNRVRTLYNFVDSDYFQTMGIELVQGRCFNLDDLRRDRLVAVINETMAERLWPNEDPLGKSFASGDVYEVIGVAKNARYYGLGEAQEPYLYFPLPKRITFELSFIVAVGPDPDTMVALVEDEIRRFDPNLGPEVLPVQSLINRSLQMPKMAATLFGVLGAFALIMAVIGLYGIMAHHIRLKRQELGIRMALGASRKRLMRMLLSHAFGQIGIGAVLGLIPAIFVSQALVDLLSGLSPFDLVVWVSVPSLLLLVVAASVYLPAREALSRNPTEALRFE